MAEMRVIGRLVKTENKPYRLVLALACLLCRGSCRGGEEEEQRAGGQSPSCVVALLEPFRSLRTG